MSAINNLMPLNSWAGLITIILLGLVLFLLWKQQKSAHKIALESKDFEFAKLLNKFHTMPFVGIGTVNAESLDWIEINPRLASIFGYETDELLNIKFTALSHPEEIIVENAFYGKLKNGEIDHYAREKRFIHKNGTVIFARVEVSAVRNANMEMEFFVIAIEDITAKITAEKALKASEERLELVVKGSNDGWWDIDLTANIAHHSERWWQMLGYTDQMDTIDPNYWQTLTHPDDIKPSLVFLRKTLASQKNHYELELRLLHKNGHYVPILTRGFIMRNKEGEAIRISGTNTDITEFKKTEQEIITLNRLLSMITNSNQVITRKPSPLVLFNEVCKIAVNEGGFSFAWVGLLTDDKNQLKCVTYAGISSKFLESLDINLQKHDYHIPATECIANGKYIICNDLTVTDYESYWVKNALDSGFRSMVALPIIRHGKVIGNFSLFSSEPQAFGNKEISLLDELALDIAFALEVEDSERQRKKAEKALIESQALFHNLASNSPAGVFRTDPTGKLTYHNSSWLSITAATAQELQKGQTFPASLHPDDNASVISAFLKSLNDNTSFNMEYRFVHPNQKVVWVKSQAQPSYNNKGVFNGFVGTLTNITELKSVQESLVMAGVVLENSREAILVTDRDANIILINKAFTTIEGYSEADALGKNPNILNSGKHDKDYFTAMYKALSERGVYQGEIWNRRKNGDLHPGILSITAVNNAQQKTTHYVSVFTDITSLKNTEDRLAFLANHDALTGLPNRLMLISHISHAIELANRNQKKIALLLLDLDRFKNINDSFGHLAGDDLLQQLSVRLKSKLRSTDMMARLGGDEFVVLLEDLTHPEYAAKVAENIISAVERPWVLNNNAEVFIGTSIGISLYPEHGDNPLDLLKHADAALYQAKSAGRGMANYYSEHLTLLARKRFKLEAKLREAILQGDLKLVYQPKFEVFSGAMVGVEALVRWVDAELGIIMPIDFIGIAEETGLINKLGEWVLKEACMQGKVWLDQGFDLSIAVNLSAMQLYRNDITEMIEDTLKNTGFPAAHLEFELTESILMGRESEFVKKLHKINDLGISLAVDDFGVGYSSLSYLRGFPLDVLKIDQSFIADLEYDKDARAITATIIAMGRTLNLKVVAEGVETESQLSFLESHGCHMYQGFYASPALEACEIEEFIRDYEGKNIFSKPLLSYASLK